MSGIKEVKMREGDLKMRFSIGYRTTDKKSSIKKSQDNKKLVIKKYLSIMLEFGSFGLAADIAYKNAKGDIDYGVYDEDFLEVKEEYESEGLGVEFYYADRICNDIGEIISSGYGYRRELEAFGNKMGAKKVVEYVEYLLRSREEGICTETIGKECLSVIKWRNLINIVDGECEDRYSGERYFRVDAEDKSDDGFEYITSRLCTADIEEIIYSVNQHRTELDEIIDDFDGMMVSDEWFYDKEFRVEMESSIENWEANRDF